MTIFLSTIEHWPVKKLIPYDRNARSRSEEQIEQIARSILIERWSSGFGGGRTSQKLGLASEQLRQARKLEPSTEGGECPTKELGNNHRLIFGN